MCQSVMCRQINSSLFSVTIITSVIHCPLRQTAITAYCLSEQLLQFVVAWLSVCQYSMAEENPADQRQITITDYFSSEQLVQFAFARRSVCRYSMAEENHAAQRQTAVTADFSSQQLLLFTSANSEP